MVDPPAELAAAVKRVQSNTSLATAISSLEEILNSYTLLNSATATTPVITAPNAYVGGIVGRMDGNAYVGNCFFGLYDNISGTSGRTADLCGELDSHAQISHCYYRDNIFGAGPLDADYLVALYPYTLSGSGYLYAVEGAHVGTLLNAQATSMGVSPWTVPTSTAVAPWLSWE